MPKRAEDNGSSVVAARLRPGLADLARAASKPTPKTTSKPAIEPETEPPVETPQVSESGGGVATKQAAPAVVRSPVRAPNDGAGRKFTKTVKYSLTQEDKAAMDELVRLIASKVGGGRSSHVIRALWSVLQQSEEAIEAMPPLAEKLNTPDNNDYPAIAVFEEELARFLERAIRRSHPS